MKLGRHESNYQIAKDIQRLQDGAVVQDAINKKFARSLKSSGWSGVLLSIGGILILDLVQKLEKRVQNLEKKVSFLEE